MNLLPRMQWQLLPLAVLWALSTTAAFAPTYTSRHGHQLLSLQVSQQPQQEEAKALLERARKLREEAARLEEEQGHQRPKVMEEKSGKATVQQAQEPSLTAESAVASSNDSPPPTRNKNAGRFLTVPETHDDQVLQAKAAVERAFADGLSRQVVRFALVPEDETLLSVDPSWPGGAKQMYRRAAGPLTRNLLQQLRPRLPSEKTEDKELQSLQRPPQIKSQDVWDFDGSAVVSAEAASGPQHDVQALVQPNTDVKYTRDIATIDKAMGPKRLFLLVNPFWRDLDSWGVNLLQPKARQRAQDAIFDDGAGFQETYVLLQKTVQGEDCIALKAYPYDWQLYAYADDNGSWGYYDNPDRIIHLGSTPEEPKSVDFAKFLAEHEQFKLSKNMRQLQRRMKQ